MASAQCQKPTTTIEVCQPKNQHGSFGQKISEMTSKAFKGHQARHGSSQNQLQCLNQTQAESQDQNSSKTETRSYGQTQTKHDNKHGITKTQITVTVVEAQITQTYEDPSPYGTTTTCFGSHAMKNGELNKDRNLFRRIKNRISRHNSEGNSSSSESDSDDEKCPKSKASEKKCSKSKISDEKSPKSKASALRFTRVLKSIIKKNITWKRKFLTLHSCMLG